MRSGGPLLELELGPQLCLFCLCVTGDHGCCRGVFVEHQLVQCRCHKPASATVRVVALLEKADVSPALVPHQ